MCLPCPIHMQSGYHKEKKKNERKRQGANLGMYDLSAWIDTRSFDIWLLWGYFCRNEGGVNVEGENALATGDHRSQDEQESDQNMSDTCERREAGEGRSDGIGETGRS